MGLRERMAAIVDGMPNGSSVSLPVSWLRRMLEQEPDDAPDLARLFTLDDVAERVSRSVSTVRTWCNTGELDGAFKLQGRDWRVPEAALLRFIEGQAGETTERPTRPEDDDADLGAWRDHYEAPDGREAA